MEHVQELAHDRDGRLHGHLPAAGHRRVEATSVRDPHCLAAMSSASTASSERSESALRSAMPRADTKSSRRHRRGASLRTIAPASRSRGAAARARPQGPHGGRLSWLTHENMEAKGTALSGPVPRIERSAATLVAAGRPMLFRCGPPTAARSRQSIERHLSSPAHLVYLRRAIAEKLATLQATTGSERPGIERVRAAPSSTSIRACAVRYWYSRIPIPNESDRRKMITRSSTCRAAT